MVLNFAYFGARRQYNVKMPTPSCRVIARAIAMDFRPIDAEMLANGFAPLEPTSRTVEVDAFCS